MNTPLLLTIIPAVRRLLRVLPCACVLAATAVAQPADSAAVPSAPPAAVMAQGDTVFVVRTPIGTFSPADRATRIRENIGAMMLLPPESMDSVRLTEQAGATMAVYGEKVLFTVTDEDARAYGTSRSTLASDWLSDFREAAGREARQRRTTSLLIDVGIGAGALLAFLVVMWIFRALFPRLYAAMERAEGRTIRGIRVRQVDVISTEAMGDFFQIIARGFRLVLTLIAIHFTLTTILGLIPWTRDVAFQPYLFGSLASILVAAATYWAIKGVLTLHGWTTNRIHGWKGTLIRPVRLRSVEVLSADRIADIIVAVTKVGRFALLAFIAYFAVSTFFGLFPLTAGWSEQLFGYILRPLGNAIAAFVAYLPNLFSILVIVGILHYLLKFIRLIARELERGTLSLPGFHADWALPTFKIVRFLIIAFGAVIIFPYLPGSDSPAFQGISVFLGILFSLGSTSAIGNVVSGVVITYMRPFKVGDRVKIADTVGDIVEKTLLVTRIRTIKNVDVTIPNAMVLGAHIVNYSSSAEHKGLVLHTTITIGYDVPWRQVHQLMLSAAAKSENVLTDPKPFILQTSLDDFYVSYELNAYTNDPSKMAATYSQLHQNIQDAFNEAGVEIMSPHYSALRDGGDSTIPPEQRPPASPPPAFRVRQERSE